MSLSSSAGPRAGRRARAFVRDDEGAITALMVLLFIGIVAATGIAIDLVRFETRRADLQDALDRGVLAAASLTQTEDAATVVEQYVETRFNKDKETTVHATPTIHVNDRKVMADAEYDLDMFFLRMLGQDYMTVGVTSGAAQSVTNIEISLVLDISGSMRNNGARGTPKIYDLIPAAKDFVSTVTDRGNSPYATVNLVRYAGQTNPGPWMFSRLGGTRGDVWSHDRSSCFYMDTSEDFSNADLPRAKPRKQVPHWMKWAIANNFMKWGWCPSDAMQIKYMVNDLSELQDAIDLIRPGNELGTEGNMHDGTGTYNAIKWGLALLNPSSQPIIAEMAEAGLVDARFADRPAAWDAEDTQKYLILMTDGIITEQYDPKYKDDPSVVTKLATMETSNHSEVSDTELFSRSTGVNYFYAQCALAKERNVKVFTIAFETTYKDEMKNCASSEAYFFEATQLNIAEVFSQIASTVQRLKLVN